MKYPNLLLSNKIISINSWYHIEVTKLDCSEYLLTALLDSNRIMKDTRGLQKWFYIIQVVINSHMQTYLSQWSLNIWKGELHKVEMNNTEVLSRYLWSSVYSIHKLAPRICLAGAQHLYKFHTSHPEYFLNKILLFIYNVLIIFFWKCPI